jgi:signal transduction histidine kinase
LLVLFLIRRGHHQAARLSLVVTAQIEIVVFSILYGSGSGIENFLVASALAPFVLFTPHERRYLIGSLACTSLALAITCAAAALEVPGILLLDKSLRESMKMIYLTSTSALVALLGWALFLLQSHKQATLEKVSLLNAQTANLASLGEMASNIAHEIASPIAAIELQTLLLSRQREGDEQVTAACQRISGICARITTIVKAIRSLSRKSQDDPHRAIDPAEAVEMAVSLCRERFKQGSVTLDVDCPVAPRLSSATRRSCHRSS